MSESPLILPNSKLTRGEPLLSQDFSNQVINADCLAVLPKLPSKSIDFVLTDPPYLAHYRDRSGRTVANDDCDGWLKPAFAEIYRVLKNNCLCVSFYGWPKVDRFFGAWRSAGFHPVAHLIWTKRYASRQRFVRYQHEQAYVLAKGSPAPPEIALGDVLRWHYTENRLHPTQKPVSGLVPVVRAFSQKNDLVLDPFCGSGSALVAAHQLGRRYLGIELDADYCVVAQKRLETKSFLANLDFWTEANVIGPLEEAGPDGCADSRQLWEQTVARVKSAIRAKTLESYRNGQRRSSRSI